jgi:predicted Ser/Thr protein kinase
VPQSDSPSPAEHLPSIAPAADPTLDRTATQRGATPPGPSGTADFDVSFLAPPEQPGELGRLAHYRVVRQLGAGGMGVVFEAEDTALARPVALKVMRGAGPADPTARTRFLREARAAAAVKHDHIVTIYQVGEDRGVPFIAMEFLRGLSLDEWLVRNPRPHLAHVAAIGREVAEGLAAAHAAGLVHRDVKPGNVWLEAPAGRVKILDFGLARPANDELQLTGHGQVVGTPAYMSPEQASGGGIDHRTDLFSLGVMVYRMCAGEPPFRGENVIALLTALAVDDPAPIQSKNPDVPPALAELIHELLRKDPAGRPAIADEVANRLRAIEEKLEAPPAPRLAEASTVTGPAIGAWKVRDRAAGPAKPARSRRLLVLGGLAFAAAAIAGTVVVVSNLRKPGEPTPPPVVPEGPRPAPGEPPVPPPSGPTGPPETVASAETAPPPREVVPKPPTPTDPEREAAEALLTRAHLKVRLGSGATAGVRRGGQLPAEPFAVTAVALDDTKYPPDYAAAVLLPAAARFRSLESLVWEPSGGLALSEAEVVTLTASPGLATLTELRGNFPLTPATLDALARLPRLRALACNGTPTTDAVLVRLPELPRLTELALSGLTAPNVTKRGLAAVAKRPLTVLALPSLKVPVDADTAGLFAAMPGLTELDLSGSDVGDEVLPELARCTGLVKLGLARTAVTDAGLDPLKGMAALRELELNKTAVTDGGAAKLAGALPRCKIWWADDKLIQPKPDAPP